MDPVFKTHAGGGKWGENIQSQIEGAKAQYKEFLVVYGRRSGELFKNSLDSGYAFDGDSILTKLYGQNKEIGMHMGTGAVKELDRMAEEYLDSASKLDHRLIRSVMEVQGIVIVEMYGHMKEVAKAIYEDDPVSENVENAMCRHFASNTSAIKVLADGLGSSENFPAFFEKAFAYERECAMNMRQSQQIIERMEEAAGLRGITMEPFCYDVELALALASIARE